MTTGSIAGLSSINLVGNELANQIWGNNGANMLSGGGGADILIGFGGDDQLIGGDTALPCGHPWFGWSCWRRLGRARRGRGAGRAGAHGDACVRRAVPRRHAAPVPAQPLPRTLRRARDRDPAPHRGDPRRPPASLLRPRRAASPGGAIVHAQGREPEDELWTALEGRPGRIRAGDVLGPRSAEEATLEGVTAVHAARSAGFSTSG